MELSYQVWNSMDNHAFRREMIKQFKIIVVEQPEDVEVFINVDFIPTFYEIWEVEPCSNTGSTYFKEDGFMYTKAKALYFIVPKDYTKLGRLKRFPKLINPKIL